MRVFFAIEFNDAIKGYIKEIQNKVRENSARGNYCHEENFHLTLQFIGEVGEVEFPKLKNCLDRAARQTGPFSLKLDRLGFFTREGRKIVWIGIKNEDKGLERIYNTLDTILYENGFQKDVKEYKPHITLSRATVFKAGFEEQLRKIKIDSKEIEVNKVSLMESTRVNGKLKYNAIYVREF